MFFDSVVPSAFVFAQEDYLPIADWADMDINSHGVDFVRISTDSSGNVYLLENTSNYVLKFSSDGELISQ